MQHTDNMVDVTEEEVQAIFLAAVYLSRAETMLSGISNNVREALLAFHGDDTSVLHCVRWGAQNAQEVCAAVVEVEG